jgi:hypothetical protein
MPIVGDSPAEAARKFSRLAGDVKNIDQRILNRSALTIKRSVQGTLRVAAPKARLNVGKKGARIGVRYDLYPKSAKVYAFGPFHLIESDTAAHRIPRGTVGRGGRKRANRKPIYIPGVGVRAWAMHPGTRGKHPWARGVAIGVPKVENAAGDVWRQTISAVFR